ncbi:MAG: hypothetical protein COV76_03715 [Candidatus Omnitrophica bacterium CG11_big_fil_rev_8_21_14_0_20_64_10]|nr:MAG: hypothetical protein COV76_03715 [Candidatus Omnitrophica bacterium CG11_big_fil_rev_8_21_14_0_20_64_10]
MNRSMRRIFSVGRPLPLTLLTAFLVAWVFPVAGAAEGGSTSLRIGYVDMERVFDGYGGTSKHREEIDHYAKERKGERDKRVAEIQRLREEEIILNAEGRDARRQQFEDKLKDLAQFDRQVEGTLRQRKEEAIGAIIDKIQAAIEEHAKKTGLNLVLSDRVVLYHDDALDVTDEVLKILNR